MVALNEADAVFLGSTEVTALMLGAEEAWSGASGWNLDGATADGVSLVTTGQDAEMEGLWVRPDGAGFFLIGNGSNTIRQYTMPTPGVLTGASYANKSIGSVDGSPSGVAFNPTGTKMYVVGFSGDVVRQFSLSTPWDVSTATDDGVTLAVGGQDGIPLDVTISPDGTKLWVLGNSTDSVYEYTLPTPFSLTGASYSGRSKSLNAQTPNMGAVAFNDDGTKMYIGSGSAPGTIYQYTLATPWNVTTATYDNISLALTTQGIQANGIGFNADGTKMFVAGGNGAGASSIHQFSLTALP